MKARFIILILIIAGSMTLTFAQSNNNDETLKSLIKQMVDAQVAFDQGMLDKIFTADYIEISPLGEVDPRAKVLGFYSPEAKAAMGDMKATIEPGECSIRNYGKYAVAIVRLDSTISKDGKQMPPRSLRATVVFQKLKKDWKIASVQYTGIRPAQPPGPKPQ